MLDVSLSTGPLPHCWLMSLLFWGHRGLPEQIAHQTNLLPSSTGILHTQVKEKSAAVYQRYDWVYSSTVYEVHMSWRWFLHWSILLKLLSSKLLTFEIPVFCRVCPEQIEASNFNFFSLGWLIFTPPWAPQGSVGVVVPVVVGQNTIWTGDAFIQDIKVLVFLTLWG